MKLIRCHTHDRPRRGAAAVELAILAPVLFGLVLGVWELGRLLHIQQIVSNAAREGGRQASTGKYTKDEVEQAVLDYLVKAGLPVNYDVNGVPDVDVNVENKTSGGEVKSVTYVAGGAEQMDELLVEVSYPYANIRWLATNFFLPADARINEGATWRTMTDIPVTISTTIPSQPLQ
jgi:hypothetical protein